MATDLGLDSVRRIEDSQVSQHDSELDEGEEVQSELFIARGEAAAFLGPAKGLLDAAVLAIGVLVTWINLRARRNAAAGE